ncbi:MAG: hypothetical protein KDA28_17180 [Phycisphaerales bacterium]|nr:hypothetical protein [Phycisphaerales bacterium]
MSETRRGAVRLASNYTRLLLSVSLGILQVPLLLNLLGIDAYGVWGLMGTTVGFAAMFREIIRYSLNRELGQAWHAPDPQRFPIVYNSAIVLCGFAAILSSLVFAILYAVVPVLNIPPELHDATRQVILAKGLYTVCFIVLSPQFNTYIVSERMVAFNVWTLLDRSSYVIVAAILFYGIGYEDQGRALAHFCWLGAGLATLFLFISVAIIMAKEPRLKVRRSLMSKGEVRDILRTSGWNGMVVLATTLHIRVDQLIMNLAFGVVGNAAFTIGLRLASYVRQLATGMSDGLDAVSVRLAETGTAKDLRQMLRQSTRLHAWVSIPAALGVVLLIEPLVHLWIGKNETRQDVIDLAMILGQVFLVGMSVRGIADGWVRFLYGSGHIKAIAPVVLIGGFCNPLLATLLLFMLPEGLDKTAPAVAFTAIMILVHSIWLPARGAKCLEIPIWAMYRPIVRPALVAVACLPVLAAFRMVVEHWTVWLLLAAIGSYGLVYIVGSLLFVMHRDERQRFAKAIRRRRARRKAASTG